MEGGINIEHRMSNNEGKTSVFDKQNSLSDIICASVFP